MTQIERYPLAWPHGQPRQRNRQFAAFKVEFARSRDELLHGLNLLRGRSVIISSNVPVRLDGLPYAGMAEPTDPGVAVYFDRRIDQDLKPFVIACDTYSKVKWNLRAIGATVEALRAIQRHGATTLLEQAFTGFAALPPKSVGSAPWWEVLGVPADASATSIRAQYLRLIQENHPDRGGDTDRAAAINVAFQQSGAVR